MNSMEISFNAMLINEAFARSAVASFIAYKNPTVNEMIEIKTIIAEGVSNAIIHGYEQNEKCYVYLKAILDDHLLKIIIQDYGKGIDDLSKVKLPFYTTLKDLEHTGMGMTIIDTLADSFEIESHKDIGTKLTITKRLKSE